MTHIAAGGYHSLFTKSDGSLWVMGWNIDGQLGIGPTPAMTTVPQQILTNGVGTVATGAYHSLFTMNRALWAMGDNDFGQLGHGTTANRYYPEQVFTLGQGVGFSFFTAIEAGWYYSLFGTSSLFSGALWGTGVNGSGELGDGTTIRHTAPEVILSVGFIVGGGDAKITAIAGGEFHSLFIKSDGSLWGMGRNEEGQLGDGTYQYHFTPVQLVSSPPQLTISPYGANVILTWTTNAVGYNLESTTNLGSSAVWTTNCSPPVVIGGQNVVINTMSGRQQFYRLSQ